jgi:hypothetical protein
MDLGVLDITAFISTVFCRKKWMNPDFKDINAIYLLIGSALTHNLT